MIKDIDKVKVIKLLLEKDVNTLVKKASKDLQKLGYDLYNVISTQYLKIHFTGNDEAEKQSPLYEFNTNATIKNPFE